MPSYYELAIIAFILIGVGTVWWFGRSNPVSTGKLHRDVSKIRQSTDEHGRQLEEISKAAEAEKLRVDTLVERMTAMETDVAGIKQVVGATAANVRTIDERQDVMAQQIAAIDVRTEHSAMQVNRLYDHIVKKGMES